MTESCVDAVYESVIGCFNVSQRSISHSSPPFPPLLLSNKVAGIVGRADLLCALFFQLSFLAYCKALNKGRHLTRVFIFMSTVLLYYY